MNALTDVRLAQLGHEPLLELLARHGRQRSRLPELTPYAHEAVEAAAEGAIEAREADERVVGHVGRPPAGPAQGAGPRVAHVGDRGPSGRAHQAAVDVPVAEGKHAAPGHDRSPGRHRGHRLGVEPREAEAVTSQCVDRRGARSAAVGAHVVGAQRVDHDHQNVRPVWPLGEAARVDGGGDRRRTDGLEELSAREVHPAECRPAPRDLQVASPYVGRTAAGRPRARAPPGTARAPCPDGSRPRCAARVGRA